MSPASGSLLLLAASLASSLGLARVGGAPAVRGVGTPPRVLQLSPCRAVVDNAVFNLEPLQRTDGLARFIHEEEDWSYVYNPCAAFSVPQHSAQSQADSTQACYHVAFCRFTRASSSGVSDTHQYQTLGVQRTTRFITYGRSPIPAVSTDTTALHIGDVKEENVDGTESAEPLDGTVNEDAVHLDIDVHLGAEDRVEAVITTAGVRYANMTQRYHTWIYLICDPKLASPGDATFERINSSHKHNILQFKLRHLCCCPNGCILPAPPKRSDFLTSRDDLMTSRDQQAPPLAPPLDVYNDVNDTRYAGASSVEGLGGRGHAATPRYLWLVLVLNGVILLIAILVGVACCRQGGKSATGGQYTYMPGLHHGSRLTVASLAPADSRYVSSARLAAPADFREYSTALLQSARLPVLDCCVISNQHVNIGQRLGGGVFADTYIAEWKKRRVAAKRLIVGGHRDTNTPTDPTDWIVGEIAYLSQQRHSSLASVLGVCIETRQPYVISEFVDGDTLRALMRDAENPPSLHRALKWCVQVAEGMSFLHSARTPVLHRDLRCANVIVERSRSKAKIVDYGLTRILQQQREECARGPNCYCQPERSPALPASLRWTAPEILAHPSSHELASDVTQPATDDVTQPACDDVILRPACDVYSFGVTLWEVAARGAEPFDDIIDDAQVTEIVLAGGRPSLDSLQGVVPHYKQLVQTCWDPDPDLRPSFQLLEVRLKTLAQLVSKTTLQGSERHDSVHDSTTTSYLRSALNLAN